MKRIAILGSSGSIGKQTLNVVRRYRDEFEVVALCVNSDVEALKNQVAEFSPIVAGICDEGAYKAAKNDFPSTQLIGGETALTEIASRNDIDIIVVAVVGMCGLKAVMRAIEHGTTVALANKESLVAGGKLVMDAAKKSGKEIRPIDSEHSAIWQCLRAGHKSDLKRIILTASGGPFYGKTADYLKSVTPEMAVNHPTWKMGRKISVDSATMMNKALEIIEARFLFDTDKIDYIIHPQSIIHSMVEFADGSIVAQLASPNMELPIQAALTYPNILPFEGARFSFDKSITFSAPDEKVFPLPGLAKQVLSVGGNAPCIFNAANEACVKLFLDNKIAFSDISINISDTLDKADIIHEPTLDDIYETFETVYDKLMRDNS